MRTATELQQAIVGGAVDIEVHAHLDFRGLPLPENPILQGTSGPKRAPEEAFLYAGLPLRSIRVRCCLTMLPCAGTADASRSRANAGLEIMSSDVLYRTRSAGLDSWAVGSCSCRPCCIVRTPLPWLGQYQSGATVRCYGTGAMVPVLRYQCYGTGATVPVLRYWCKQRLAAPHEQSASHLHLCSVDADSINL